MFSMAIQDSNNTGNRPEIIRAVYFMDHILYSQNKLFKSQWRITNYEYKTEGRPG